MKSVAAGRFPAVVRSTPWTVRCVGSRDVYLRIAIRDRSGTRNYAYIAQAKAARRAQQPRCESIT